MMKTANFHEYYPQMALAFPLRLTVLTYFVSVVCRWLKMVLLLYLGTIISSVMTCEGKSKQSFLKSFILR